MLPYFWYGFLVGSEMDLARSVSFVAISRHNSCAELNQIPKMSDPQITQIQLVAREEHA
jgi:hypothetical protein